MRLKRFEKKRRNTGNNAEVQQETIRAVVQAYADGRIELERPKAMGKGGFKNIRMAPNFREIKFSGTKFNNGDHPYNAESVARFLGWTTPKGQVLERDETWDETGEIARDETGDYLGEWY